MKQFLSAAFLATGLVIGGVALAQGPPMPGADPTLAPGAPAPAYDTGTAYDYQTTGWDPTLLLYASGGLALGSVALKGALRKRA